MAELKLRKLLSYSKFQIGIKVWSKFVQHWVWRYTGRSKFIQAVKLYWALVSR